LCILLLATNSVFARSSLSNEEKTGFAVFFVFFIIMTVTACVVYALKSVLKEFGDRARGRLTGIALPSPTYSRKPIASHQKGEMNNF
jgi:hypothetical protein